MLNASIRRKAVLLVLFAILVVATPWASAAGSQPERPQSVQALEPAALELFSRVWSLLQRAGSKEGCHIDPWGQTSPPQTKEGCNIDPWGHLPTQAPTPQTKVGCQIDPWGRCLS
jgi:hypothetical protein